MKSFKFFDFKNSGEVDYPTFQRAIAKIGVAVDDSDLADYFMAYDTNGNGRLDYKEFTNIVFGRQAATPMSARQGPYDTQSQWSKASYQQQQQQPQLSYRGIKE
jgi:EF-hand domain pair